LFTGISPLCGLLFVFFSHFERKESDFWRSSKNPKDWGDLVSGKTKALKEFMDKIGEGISEGSGEMFMIVAPDHMLCATDGMLSSACTGNQGPEISPRGRSGA
jgi:hypothetical protein